MIHKPPEPEGEGCCCDHKSQSAVIYLLYSIISLALLLLNGSFYCKQGMLLANMLVVYTVNKVAIIYKKKQNL